MASWDQSTKLPGQLPLRRRTTPASLGPIAADMFVNQPQEVQKGETLTNKLKLRVYNVEGTSQLP